MSDVTPEIYTLGRHLLCAPVQSAFVARAFGTGEDYPFTLHTGFIFVVNRTVIRMVNVKLYPFHSFSSITRKRTIRQTVLQWVLHTSCHTNEIADEGDKEEEKVGSKTCEEIRDWCLRQIQKPADCSLYSFLGRLSLLLFPVPEPRARTVRRSLVGGPSPD